MSAIRTLHVDDEPDIREIVDISLSLNSDFELRSCASGAEAIVVAAEWLPFLILLDVMMPEMDGPTTLANLRKNPQTSDIPVFFMTARAQTREIDRFLALGAQGVILKPFDPMTLAADVRKQFQALRLATLRGIFVRRAKTDAALLKQQLSRRSGDWDAAALDQVRQIADGLAAAAFLVGFAEISGAAGAVEKAARAKLGGSDAQTDLAPALDRLLLRLDNDFSEPSAAVA